MISRPVRSLALAALLSAGLVAWSGCTTENPDGTPNKLGKAEEVIKKDAQIVGDKAKDLGHKAVEGAKAAGEEIKKDAKIVGDKVKEEAKVISDKVKGTETPAPTTTPTTTPTPAPTPDAPK